MCVMSMVHDDFSRRIPSPGDFLPSFPFPGGIVPDAARAALGDT